MEQPKWISVEERLPEPGQEVFVYGPREPKRLWLGNPMLFYPQVSIVWQTRRMEKPGCYTDGSGFLRAEGYADCFITHWFPIPVFDGTDGQPRWISVEERLPEPDVEVIVYGTQMYQGNSSPIVPPVELVWSTKRAEQPMPCTDENLFCRLWGYGIYKITHWHPMPKIGD